MTGRIVVGVDGSDVSRKALRWAAEQALARPAVVEAVTVWHRSFDYGRQSYWPVDEDVAVQERTRLAEAATQAADLNPGVEIEQRVLQGDPARVLVERSAGADLLVVGSRGLGGFTGLVLGSVSTQCAHHSRCPVVIIPKDWPG